MARTTADKVRGVLMRDYDTVDLPSLTPFVETANSLTDEVAAVAAGRNVSLGSARLELIERWLAAHFYSQSDRPYAENMTRSAQAKYQGQTGMHLESSFYGQTAMVLDTSGALRSLNSPAGRAYAAWLGKAPSEQTDYVERD